MRSLHGVIGRSFPGLLGFGKPQNRGIIVMYCGFFSKQYFDSMRNSICLGNILLVRGSGLKNWRLRDGFGFKVCAYIWI